MRQYIHKALNGESNVSDLLISAVTNELVLMFAAPIEQDGEVVGALIGRRPGDALSKLAEDNGYGKKGYAFMINGEGTVVAHRDIERVLEQFNPLEHKNEENMSSSPDLSKRRWRKPVSGVFQRAGSVRRLHSRCGNRLTMIVTADRDEVLSSVSLLQRDLVVRYCHYVDYHGCSDGFHLLFKIIRASE